MTTAVLTQVRALIGRMLESGEVVTIGALADLMARSGPSVDDLVDEVVADQLRRNQPRMLPGAIAVDLGETIADLVAERIDIDHRLDQVWHLIGRGEASVKEFEALRSTLTVDIGHRFAPWIRDMSSTERRDAVRAIDSTLSPSAVRELRHHRMESVVDARRILTGEVQQLCDRFCMDDRGGPGRQPAMSSDALAG